MWASCMFIHEMRLEAVPLFTLLSAHSLHFCLDLKLPGKSSLSLCLLHLSLSPSVLLSYLLSFCSPWIVSQLVG